MGRPRVHEDRKAVYRAKFSRVDLPLDPELAATLDDIAGALDVSKVALCVSMLKFALTNHDWKRFGLTHKRTTQDKNDAS